MSGLSSANGIDYPYSAFNLPTHVAAKRALDELRQVLTSVKAAKEIGNQADYDSAVDTLAQKHTALSIVAQESAGSLALMLSLWKTQDALLFRALTTTSPVTTQSVRHVLDDLRDTLPMSSQLTNNLVDAYIETNSYLFDSAKAARIRNAGEVLVLPQSLKSISLLDGEKPHSIHDIASTLSSIPGLPRKMYAFQVQRFKRRREAAQVLVEVESQLQRGKSGHATAFGIIDTVADYEAAVAFDETKDWMTPEGAAVTFESLYGSSSVVFVPKETAREGLYVDPNRRAQLEDENSHVRDLIAECKKSTPKDNLNLRDLLAFRSSLSADT